jgi:ATP-dependent helicase/nuclease subunit A
MSREASESVHLTDEQRRALEVTDCSVALGAGAGCGKTTVLTERFLGAIEGDRGRPLRELVALTFTDKAARELRQRIRERCREKLAADAEPEEIARWRNVLRGLEAAPIGTFHDFCARLLRTWAIEIGIDPEFTIFDASVAASLRDQAVRSSLRRMLAERHPDLTYLALDYGLRQIRVALTTLAATRVTASLDDWTGLSAEELLDRWRQLWERTGRPAALRFLLPPARSCRALLEAMRADHPKLQQRRSDLLDALSRLEAGPCSDELLVELRGLAKVSDLGAKGIWLAPETKELIKNAFESLRKKIDVVVRRLDVNEALSLESAQNSLRLWRLSKLVSRDYEHVKERRRGLDFDDLLVLTRQALEGRPASDALAPADGIQFVLVDEFQDTDRVQSEILRLLGGESLFRGRMFVVGDAKQSIYRFRGAEPAILGQWRNEFTTAGRLRLSENFRSVPGVVHFVNALFADCFTEVDPDGRLEDGQRHRLIPVRPNDCQQPAVSFLWAVQEAAPDSEPARTTKTSADQRRTQEARALAGLIFTRLKAGWTVIDRKTKQPRPAHAGDVAFLFRALTDVGHYERALADLGFDYHTVGGSAFYAQQEIRDVVNVLSVVEDPLDEVALAGALRSPFFHLSDDGLYWLARACKGGLAEGLERAGAIDELPPPDRRAAIRARDLLGRWRGFKDRLPLANLLALVLDESGFEAALVSEFLGPRKLANARKLVRIARSFDEQGGFSLADFVARLREDLNNPPHEEQAATTEEDSPTIRLMSIHQAKGLEFPIVVIPDLNRKPNPRDSFLGLHPALGLVVRPPHAAVSPSQGEADATTGESLGWLAYQAIEAEEDRREALRLFYVAATRARDHLILSAGMESVSDEEDGTPAEQASPRPVSPACELLMERFDWRTGRCLVPLPETWPAPRVDVIVAGPESSPPPGTPPRRPSLKPLPEIERVIAQTEVRPERQPAGPRPLLRFVELDPERNLTGRAARLDGLIRAIIADKGLLGGESLAQACARVAARQVPAANSGLITEALAWLAPWLETPLFGELRAASRTSRFIKQDVWWSLRWPLEGTASTIIRGCCDVIYRDGDGRWRPVIVSASCRQEDDPREQLRLVLSALAAERLGFVPGGPGWWLQFESTGVRAHVHETESEAASIGRMVNACADLNRADAGRFPA